MTSNEIYETMTKLWTEFSDNHTKFVDKGNRAAATRARKAIGDYYDVKEAMTFIEELTGNPVHIYSY